MANNVANSNGYTINYPGVKLDKVHKVENANYVFLDLNISPSAKPGTIKIKNGASTIDFELKKRRQGNGTTFCARCYIKRSDVFDYARSLQ